MGSSSAEARADSQPNRVQALSSFCTGSLDCTTDRHCKWGRLSSNRPCFLSSWREHLSNSFSRHSDSPPCAESATPRPRFFPVSASRSVSEMTCLVSPRLATVPAHPRSWPRARRDGAQLHPTDTCVLPSLDQAAQFCRDLLGVPGEARVRRIADGRPSRAGVPGFGAERVQPQIVAGRREELARSHRTLVEAAVVVLRVVVLVPQEDLGRFRTRDELGAGG